MRTLLSSTAMIAALVWIGMAPATATPRSMLGIGNTNAQVALVEQVGYWRRYYRRYGYPVPYGYYPPTYGYYLPPSTYAYPSEGDYADAPPADGDNVDAPPGDYVDAPPQGDYADGPPPESY
jgi:hypothetical protein